MSFHVAVAFVPCHKGQISAAVAVHSSTGRPAVTPVGRGRITTSTAIRSSNIEDATNSVESETKNMFPNATMLLSLLDDAIAYQPSAAVALLNQIEEMRRTGSPREDIEQLVDNLLSSGPDSSSLPLWSKFRPLTRFSRRARLATLRRTLDLTTPPPSEDENSDMTKVQRRRRALLSLLRDIGKQQALSNDDGGSSSSKDKKLVAIVSIFLKAKQMSKMISSAELKSRMPEGLESPKYEVLANRGAQVEIRRYEPYSLCSVSMNTARPANSSRTDATLQMPQMSGASSFGALAGYLFGKNDKSTAMKMTTPVFTANVDEVDEKQMSFVLPSQYWDEGQLLEAPQPLSGSGVKLEQIQSQDRAVIMFGGFASKKEVDLRKKTLLAAIQKDSEWQALSKDITVAQYNDPFTAPWRRLNEVSVPVVAKM